MGSRSLSFLIVCILVVFFPSVTHQKCDKVVDVAFLIDSSGSLGTRNYRLTLDAVNNMSTYFDLSPLGSHGAAIVYSAVAINPITFNEYLTLDQFKRRIANLPFLNSNTRMDLALDMAAKKVFTETGNVRDYVPKIAILLTDGRQTRSAGQTPLRVLAENLRRKGVDLFVIGIGKQVQYRQLRDMVVRNNHLVQPKDFYAFDEESGRYAEQFCQIIKAKYQQDSKHSAGCKHPVELGFILHSSEKLNERKFNRIRQYISGIATAVGIDGIKSRAGLILYSNDAYVRLRFDEPKNKERFTNVLTNVRLVPGENRMDLALKTASEELFTERSRSSVSRIAVLVTIGNPTKGVASPKLVAARLKARGIKIFVIAIGSNVDDAELGGVVLRREHFFKSRNIKGMNSLVTSVASQICDESVPTARRLTAVPKSFSEIHVNWELPWDPEKAITGYELSWRMIEDDKGENIVNAPSQSSLLSPKSESYLIRNLDPYSVYKILLSPQWQDGMSGGEPETQARTLEDFNECLRNPCDANAVCTDSPRSFKCKCKPGYSGDGFTCTDNDECLRNPCDANAKCSNTPGSFSCECNNGFSGDGFRCSDVDECRKNPCDTNAKCTNTRGSFRCQCNRGYFGNGFSCADIDECRKNPCDTNARCTNTRGSFRCRCNRGYFGNGFSCTDVDECRENPCDTNARCTNTRGSFRCQCNRGYLGNGYSCADIDECSRSPCDANGRCTNTPGSFTCQCNTGFSGNGFTCEGHTCGRVVDIAFLIDSSGSLGIRNYRLTLDAVNNIATYFNLSPLGSHGAAIVYSAAAINPIAFNEYLTLDQFKRRIVNLPFMNSNTRMDLALDLAAKEVFTEKGNVRDYVPKIAILLTDGVQTRSAGQTPLRVLAANLRRKGVDLFVIGIGRGVRYHQLREMVVRNNRLVQPKGFNAFKEESGRYATQFCQIIKAKYQQDSKHGAGCQHPVELGFILHSAKNLNDKKFNRIKQYISGIATAVGIDGIKSRAGLILYSNDASVRLMFDEPKNKQRFTKVLTDLRLEPGENRLDLALKTASEELFTERSRSSVSRIAVLVTIGNPAKGVASPKLVAAQLRTRGIKTLVIAIGSNVDDAELEGVVFRPKNLFKSNNIKGMNSLVRSVASQICDESVPTARQLTAVPKSFSEIHVKWQLPLDPEKTITGYDLSWRMIENDKGENIVNAPPQSSLLPSKSESHLIKDLDPYSLYKIALAPQWQEGVTGDEPETQARTLQDLNECLQNPCDVNAVCTDSPRSFKCKCKPGYSGDGFTCTDDDECLRNPCDANASCNNSPGSFSCECNSGFFGDGFKCSDVDECLKNPCDTNAKCTNTRGSFTCQCDRGYSGDGFSCTDINECSRNPCDANARCTNTPGSFTCQCNTGFSGNGFTCADDDECADSPCDENAKCDNTIGSFTCKCNTGYSGDGFTCADIDECGDDPCDTNAKCTNTPGSFTCKCNPGYSGDGLTCTDNVECLKNPCDANAKCTNSPGSFSCACNTGFSGDGFKCSDVDECLKNPCDSNAKCTNTRGSFTCQCNKGYSGDGFSCTDINECSRSPCDTNARCTNTPGSFTCQCNSGFSGDGFTCVDDKECAESPCDKNARCDNTLGSFTCKCNIGYSGDGFTCADIDECGDNPCDTNAKCTNTPGSFTCQCNPGYSGNGLTCTDVEECFTSPCDANAKCTNTPGSFSCQCNTGYSGDGLTCTDNNECIGDPCDEHARCSNSPGSFKCECNAGYAGNGFSCKDVNECEFEDKPCDVNAKCFNTEGSYYCKCNVGYNGNGRVCSVVNICSYPMDLAIAVDTSDSITKDNFQTQKAAIIMLARSFGLSRLGTHVAVIVYGSEASMVIPLEKYTTFDEFSDAVRELPYEGGNTRIDKALNVASSRVFSNARSGMPKMLIIMTDGQQTSAPDAIPLTDAVEPLRSSGVKVVTIAIGKEFDEYELLAISESRENIHHVQSFDTLFDTISKVGESLCQEARKDCNNYADIALLVDSSASMRGGNYLKEKALVKAIGREFDVSLYRSHAAIVLYNTEAEVMMRFNNKTTLQEFEMAVDKLPLKGGKIRLDKAIRLAASDVFTKKAGMRSDVQKFMFILTDGTQNRQCDEDALELAIAPLRSQGVHVVVIGVGEADERELRPLVKSSRDLFTGIDFDEVTERVMEFIKGHCSNYGQSCTVGSQFVDVRVGDCVSETPVEISVCDGRCPSGTHFIAESPFYESRCTCCLPRIITPKEVLLKCGDKSTKPHRIAEASACECRSCENAVGAPPISDFEEPDSLIPPPLPSS